MEYFCVIAECENLTKAAQRLHVSQPSLSRSLHALEDELGTTLFDRVGRNIVLNNAGRIARERIVAVLNSTDAVKRDIEEFIHDKNLTVNIYSPVPMGDNEDVTISFKRKYPDIRIRIGQWHSPSEALRKIQPDITFFASSLVHKEPNYLMLGEEDIMVAVSHKNPLASRDSVALAELSDMPYVSVLPSALYDITHHMCLEAGFTPNVVVEAQDYNRVLSYVAEDFGFTLAPTITWFDQNHTSRVAVIPISDVQRRRYLYIKWPENTVMNRATLRFREHLVEYFNEHYGFTCKI